MSMQMAGAGCLPRGGRAGRRGRRSGSTVPPLVSPKHAASSGAPPAGRSAFGAFARFVLFGGGVGLASSAAVPLVATLMPWAVANALITVASTLLGTELHARFTFGAGRRAQWRQHVQSAGSATAAYLVTSAAILILHAVQPSAGIRWEQAVYLSASALAGVGRFLVLRLYVFARGRTPSAERPVRAGTASGGPRSGRRATCPAQGRARAALSPTGATSRSGRTTRRPAWGRGG